MAGSTSPIMLIKGRYYHMSFWIFDDIGGGSITVYYKKGDKVDYIDELTCANLIDLPFVALDWFETQGIKPNEIIFQIPN